MRNIERRGSPCLDFLYSVPQCCAANVLDVASLDCKTPSSADSVFDFKASCSDGKAQCCSVPAAEQGILCVDPVGA
ncbi:Cerato-ulmin hydrophobin family [Mycena leptocephala]|nr:Cerato-ulmin hydrophobin family [Mycena leptocephala]